MLRSASSVALGSSLPETWPSIIGSRGVFNVFVSGPKRWGLSLDSWESNSGSGTMSAAFNASGGFSSSRVRRAAVSGLTARLCSTSSASGRSTTIVGIKEGSKLHGSMPRSILPMGSLSVRAGVVGLLFPSSETRIVCAPEVLVKGSSVIGGD